MSFTKASLKSTLDINGFILNLRNLKELEQKYGLNAPERTEVVIGFDNMLEMTRYGFSIVDKGFDCLWDAEFVSILPVYFADGVSEATRLVNEKGIKIRVITEIKKDNLESVVQLSKLYDVRHLQGIKGNFGILDRRQYIVVLFSSYDKPPNRVFSVMRNLSLTSNNIFSIHFGKQEHLPE